MKAPSFTAIALIAIVCFSCSKSSVSGTNAPLNTPSSNQSTTAAAVDEPPSSASQTLFDPSTPLVEGQDLRVVGLVEYRNPEEDIDVSTASGRLQVANGDFDILLDTRGEEIVKTLDGKLAEVRGTLTGHYLSNITAAVSYGLNGSISKVTRTPEIKVIEFKSRALQEGTDTIVDNGDGTITDKKAGLMWQKIDDGHKRTWNVATEYAKSLTVGGYSDWRLPSLEELGSLWKDVGRKRKLRNQYLPGVNSVYWTSTLDKDDSGWAARVSFDPHEGVGNTDKGDPNYVRCVRTLRK